jgi:hypothetical protein
MLEWKVEVRQEPRVRGNHVEQSLGEVIGMDVEKTDPEIALQGGDVGKQRHQLGPSAVLAVGAQVLGNEDELLYSPVTQSAYLCNDLGPVPACKSASYEGDGAVRAAIGAALRDLHVGAAGE